MDAKRLAVVGLHLAGKSKAQIVRELAHMNVHKSFVYRVIKRYIDTGSVDKRSNGGPKRSARSPEMVKKVHWRIQRNPRQSANKMAVSLKISRRSIQRILKTDLQLKPLKIHKVQDLTPAQKKVRLQRAKKLKRLSANGLLPNIVFSDEKIFTVQQYLNKQNDRVWLRGRSIDNLGQRVVTRKQGPASVMVWAGVTAEGRTPLVFIDQGVKVNQQVYRKKVLNDALLPWARKQFGSRPWTFQQDSAPSHKAIATQQFLRKRVPRLISSQEWPPYSPDLNPMDFSIWSILEAKVGTKKHASVEALKKCLQHEWAKIPQSHIRSACDAFITRLGSVVRAKGGHIENR